MTPSSLTFLAPPTLRTSHINIALDSSYQFSDTHILAAGIGFGKEGIDDSANQSTHNLTTFEFAGGGLRKFEGEDSFTNNEDREIFSAYFQDRLVFEGVILTAGVRYDAYDDFGNTLNPRASLVYTVPWDSKLKIMYGEAFRAPTIGELFNRNSPGLLGNRDLDAEEIQAVEVAYLQKLGSNEASITYFRNEIDNIITEIPSQPGSFDALRIVNQGSKTSDGIEIDCNITLWDGLHLRGTFSYLFSGNDAFSPRELASLIINYKYGRISCRCYFR